MSKIIDLSEHRPTPIDSKDGSDFQARHVPEREWLIEGLLEKRGVTMLSGNPGDGKSLLCVQLQAAGAAGLGEFLGMKISSPPLRTLALYCEDDEDELHRRLYACCNHYGVHFKDLGSHARYLCRVGEENNALMVFGRDERGTRTPFYWQLLETVRLYEIDVLILDPLADLFIGNENSRPQARAFITALRWLAIQMRGGVILTAHPSRSGQADGTGQSGSTAWNASVRTRAYLTRQREGKDDDGDQKYGDGRTLRVLKANYGPGGRKIKFRYDHGAFALDGASVQSPYWSDQ